MANAPHLPRDGRSYGTDLGENESRIFNRGLDTISENQKRFAGHVDLSQLWIEIALAHEANPFGATCLAVAQRAKAKACHHLSSSMS
jgi:hypothetical protein